MKEEVLATAGGADLPAVSQVNKIRAVLPGTVQQRSEGWEKERVEVFVTLFGTDMENVGWNRSIEVWDENKKRE